MWLGPILNMCLVLSLCTWGKPTLPYSTVLYLTLLCPTHPILLATWPCLPTSLHCSLLQLALFLSFSFSLLLLLSLSLLSPSPPPSLSSLSLVFVLDSYTIITAKPTTELKNGCRIVQRTRLHRHFPLAFTSLCVHVHIVLCLLVEINSLRPGSGLDTKERTLDKAGCLETIKLTTVLLYKYQYGRSLLGRLYKTTSTKVAKRLAGV